MRLWEVGQLATMRVVIRRLKRDSHDAYGSSTPSCVLATDSDILSQTQPALSRMQRGACDPIGCFCWGRKYFTRSISGHETNSGLCGVSQPETQGSDGVFLAWKIHGLPLEQREAAV